MEKILKEYRIDDALFSEIKSEYRNKIITFNSE